MKKVKSFIIALFAFFFMFGISSCNLEGLMSGLVVPSVQISGLENSSSDSTLDRPIYEEDYLNEAIAQYGDLVNYYMFVESEVQENIDKIQLLKEVYTQMQTIGFEIENNSKLSKDQYAYISDMIFTNESGWR